MEVFSKIEKYVGARRERHPEVSSLRTFFQLVYLKLMYWYIPLPFLAEQDPPYESFRVKHEEHLKDIHTHRILVKYGSHKYDEKRDKRVAAYKKAFNMGNDCWIENDVWVSREHQSQATVQFGHEVLLAKYVNIDYTGGLIVGNGVDIGEGAKILTHGHSYMGSMFDDKLMPNTNRAYATPLTIGDNVLIGARSIIMPGVKSIGENSIISVGSIVGKSVPPNSVVAGNPAKVIFNMPEGYRTYFKYNK